MLKVNKIKVGKSVVHKDVQHDNGNMHFSSCVVVAFIGYVVEPVYENLVLNTYAPSLFILKT